MPDNNIQNMTPEEMAKAFQEFVFPSVPCGRCAHKEVCRLTENGPKECGHFLNFCNPHRYGDIYIMFQPIFDWLKIHYPHGEVKFIVDSKSAKMWQEHGPSAYSKELTDVVNRATGKENTDAPNP